MKKLSYNLVKEIVLNRCQEKNYMLIEPLIYINSYSKLHLRCNIDNHEWRCSYSNFINHKKGCPKCSRTLKHTQQEAEISINNICNEKKYTLIKPFIYKNNKTKIWLKCNHDNYEWELTYDNFINNKTGCPKCAGRLKLTQLNVENTIMEKCKEKNYQLTKPFIYTNNKTRIYLKCNLDGYEWDVRYYNLINSNKGCPKCSGSLKLTQLDVENTIMEKCKEKNYKLIEPVKYIGSDNTRIFLKCNIDDHEWDVKYNNFINQNAGCPKCGGNLKLDQKDIDEKIMSKCKEKNYTLIEPFIYENFRNKMHLRCNVCDHEWKTTYDSFIGQNHNCLSCSKKMKMTDENDAKTNVLNRCLETNYKLIGTFKYIGSQKTKICLRCDIDDNEWCTTYNIFVNNKSGCPKCRWGKAVKTMIEKYGEAYFYIIPKHNEKSIFYLDIISEKLSTPIQHALNGGEKKFIKYWVDGYIEEHNICIEWDEKHHKYKKIKDRDVIREQFIKDNFNCHIIRINEKEFLLDVENQIEIICNKINNIINGKYI